MSILLRSILPALAALLIGFILTITTAVVIKVVLHKIVKRTKSETDDFIASVIISNLKPFGFILTSLISIKLLPLENEIDLIVTSIAQLFIIILLVRLTNRITLKIMESWSRKINDMAIGTMLRSLRPMVRATIWSLGITIFLQNIGVQMAAIWALLSAGGIGAGLALKEPVQEFFEYITILLDKPFQSGQFINIENVWATVERVGVRSTRLRSVNGEVIIMSNSSLTSGIISNYGEMQQRRLVHRLGIIYDTSLQKIEDIPTILKKIIDSTPDALYDRCHFIEFGPSSLDFELVYFIPTNNYIRAMEAQQSINIAIKREFELNQIEFAYPTSTIHLLRDQNT